MKKFVKSLNAVLALLLFNIWSAVGYYTLKLPDSYYIAKGDTLTLNTALNIEAQIKDTALQSSSSTVFPMSQTASLKLMGIIPVKDVEVLTVETPVLVPGGKPFGIKMLMDGVMVISMGEVVADGESRCPAAGAGIRKGDVILSVDGKDVDSNMELQEAIADSDGEPVEIVLVRDGNDISVELVPVFSETANTYQAGMWVRDSTAGIGTITFYEPSTGLFGGLGHPICDTDTGEIIPLSKGEIVDVQINNIKKGFEGLPGELQGSFITSKASGVVNDNNKYGIYGTMNEPISDTGAIPLAMKQEIQEGEATILTTVDGTEPREYTISIEKIDYKSVDTAKNMVIRVTDEELIKQTGGIVQGMSGSPIIQNGKLVGAVTHVFVNDPTKGYAVFAENMYQLGA